MSDITNERKKHATFVDANSARWIRQDYCEQLERELADAQAECARLRVQLGVEQSEHSHLSEEMERRNAEVAKMREELAGYRGHIHTCNGEVVERLQAENVKLRSSIGKLLNAVDNVACEHHAPAYCRIVKMANAAAAVREIMGGGK